ncbi:MAG: hypothetical protein RRY29_00145 [Desulfovibrionaceae bacterium]
MSETLLWVHPLMQTIAVMLGTWAMWQGWKRVQMQRGVKVIFPWKQHVRWGAVALIMWTLGALGFYVTLDLFGSTHITGLHAQLAWPIIALSIFGLVTGYSMDKYKRKRVYLNVTHGIVNILLMVLVIIELITGFLLLETFL